MLSYTKKLRAESSNCTQWLCLGHSYRMSGLALTKCNPFIEKPLQHKPVPHASPHSQTTHALHTASSPQVSSQLGLTKQSDNTGLLYTASQFSQQAMFYFLKRLGKRIFRSQVFLAGKIPTRPTHWWWKCYLSSRKSWPWDDSMKMESSIELTACTWWVTLPSSSANSMAPHSATRAFNLSHTCTRLAVQGSRKNGT